MDPTMLPPEVRNMLMLLSQLNIAPPVPIANISNIPFSWFFYPPTQSFMNPDECPIDLVSTYYSHKALQLAAMPTASRVVIAIVATTIGLHQIFFHAIPILITSRHKCKTPFFICAVVAIVVYLPANIYTLKAYHDFLNALDLPSMISLLAAHNEVLATGLLWSIAWVATQLLGTVRAAMVFGANTRWMWLMYLGALVQALLHIGIPITMGILANKLSMPEIQARLKVVTSLDLTFSFVYDVLLNVLFISKLASGLRSEDNNSWFAKQLVRSKDFSLLVLSIILAIVWVICNNTAEGSLNPLWGASCMLYIGIQLYAFIHLTYVSTQEFITAYTDELKKGNLETMPKETTPARSMSAAEIRSHSAVPRSTFASAVPRPSLPSTARTTSPLIDAVP